MATTTMGSTQSSNRTLYWGIAIAVLVVLAIAYAMQSARTNNTTGTGAANSMGSTVNGVAPQGTGGTNTAPNRNNMDNTSGAGSTDVPGYGTSDPSSPNQGVGGSSGTQGPSNP